MGQWQILVVEDDKFSSDLVYHMLAYRNMAVDVVQSGAQALERLERKQYHLAILDLAMSGMDGWQLIAAIHARPNTANLLCVAVTAYDHSGIAEAVAQAGFVAYFLKPLHMRFAMDIERILSASHSIGEV